MGSSSTRDVHPSDGTQGVDKSKLHFHDRPLRHPPPIRRGVTVPPNLWTSSLCRSNDSVHHYHAPVQPSRPAPENGRTAELFAILEKRLQQVRIEVDTVTTALQTATAYVEQMEKEKNGYKMLAYRNGMRYSRIKEERNRLWETSGTSSQEPRSEGPVPYSSPPLRDDESRSSSAGPSRRNSTLKKRRQSLESCPLGNRRRSGSADSSSSSSERESASFAVTSVAPSLPAQTIYRRDGNCDVQYIRDASRPEQSPRPASPPHGRDEIGIHHVDLMYEPSVAERISCRACWRKKGDSAEVTEFPCHAAWRELREHYITEHPRTCQEIARLTPCELDELRRYGIVPNNARR